LKVGTEILIEINDGGVIFANADRPIDLIVHRSASPRTACFTPCVSHNFLKILLSSFVTFQVVHDIVPWYTSYSVLHIPYYRISMAVFSARHRVFPPMTLNAAHVWHTWRSLTIGFTPG
jgi:hypothetical protein